MNFEYEIFDGLVTLWIDVDNFDETELEFSAYFTEEVEGKARGAAYDVTECIYKYGINEEIEEYFFENLYAEYYFEREAGDV